MRKRKVCFPMPHFELGGLERVQMYIAKGLLQSDYQVDLITRSVTEQAKSLIEPEVNVHETSRGRFNFLFTLLYDIKNNRPEVIITSANDIGYFILFWQKIFFSKTKVIWTQHLSISGPLKGHKGLGRYKLLFEIWLIKRLIKRADAIVAVSYAVANDMKKMLRSDLNIKVIYNPVISDDFENKMNQVVEWPWKDYSCPTIIFVGRLAKIKRLDLLMHAFSQCKKKIPIRLLVIGDGLEIKSTQALADELDLGENCKFLGYQNNPTAWISKSDLLVLCSDTEGFGLVLIEAMACGTQVLSTDCPDGPAEMLGNGRYGRLVPMNNIDALAVGMVECLQNPLLSKAQLAARAELFSVGNAIEKYQSLLLELQGQDE